jgi:hypothetical protein
MLVAKPQNHSDYCMVSCSVQCQAVDVHLGKDERAGHDVWHSYPKLACMAAVSVHILHQQILQQQTKHHKQHSTTSGSNYRDITTITCPAG